MEAVKTMRQKKRELWCRRWSETCADKIDEKKQRKERQKEMIENCGCLK